MKIGFVSTNKSLSVGSYRIWVNDLNDYFNSIGVQSKILDNTDNFENYDTLIFSKNDVDHIQKVKNQFPNKKYGAINLASDKTNIGQDFLIVGSIEEKISLSHYSNVFMFPLVENLFQNCKMKEHTIKDPLVIGCHGSYTHLCKFSPYLNKAIEEFSKEREIKLNIITSPDFNGWKVGIPNIKNIEISFWDINTFKDKIGESDIGIVPNITSQTPAQFDHTSNDPDLGLYSTDYMIRFKNKSNAGRSFVFHQLGIPVIADITPSNFHILGDETCGFLAHYKDSWLNALRYLSSPNARQEIANNAKTRFDNYYDPLQWAQKLYDNIKEIKDDI